MYRHIAAFCDGYAESTSTATIKPKFFKSFLNGNFYYVVDDPFLRNARYFYLI